MTTNKNLRCGLELNDIYFAAYLHEVENEIYYRVFFKQTLLFCGNNHYLPEQQKPFTLYAITQLLEFLAPPGEDNPNPANQSYTEDQLGWFKTEECKTLYQLLWLYQRNAGGFEFLQSAQQIFEAAYAQYIHPDSFNLQQVVRKKFCSFEEGWHHATIALTTTETQNFITLLNEDGNEDTKKKLMAAVADHFKKVQADGLFEDILFKEGDVKFFPKNKRIGITEIRKRIIKNY